MGWIIIGKNGSHSRIETTIKGEVEPNSYIDLNIGTLTQLVSSFNIVNLVRGSERKSFILKILNMGNALEETVYSELGSMSDYTIESMIQSSNVIIRLQNQSSTNTLEAYIHSTVIRNES